MSKDITNSRLADMLDEYELHDDRLAGMIGLAAERLRAMQSEYVGSAADERSGEFKPDWANYQQGRKDGMADANEALCSALAVARRKGGRYELGRFHKDARKSCSGQPPRASPESGRHMNESLEGWLFWIAGIVAAVCFGIVFN